MIPKNSVTNTKNLACSDFYCVKCHKISNWMLLRASPAYYSPVDNNDGNVCPLDVVSNVT